MSYAFWGVEFCKMHGKNIIAYLWIDYDELKFDGYVLLEPDKYLEWKKLEKQGEKKPPEYYEYAELIIGESSLEEDVWNAGWGLDTGVRKIFVNPDYAENLIPELIKDILKRHREEWITAWAIYLVERATNKEIRKIKARRVGNSLVVSARGLEEDKEYNRLRTKNYDNLLIIYRTL